MSITIEAMAIEQLQSAIELNVLDAEDLQRVKARLEARTAWQNSWRVGINGERGMALPVFNDPGR